MDHKELLSGTRVFGKLAPQDYGGAVRPFIDEAKKLGDVVIVSQTTYPHLLALQEFVGTGAKLVCSDTKAAESPADMCNRIVVTSVENGSALFAIISSDLAQFIPTALPVMLDRLRSDASLTSVGVAIQNIHDFTLLEKARANGLQEVTPDNFAKVFHNNAFGLHRVNILAKDGKQLSLPERLFPRISDSKKLGEVIIDGESVPIGGNEEIAFCMELLKRGIAVNTLLLAGDYSLIRDRNKEVTTLDKKVARRPAVARHYQEYYGISNEELGDYLQSHYRIDFGE